MLRRIRRRHRTRDTERASSSPNPAKPKCWFGHFSFSDGATRAQGLYHFVRLSACVHSQELLEKLITVAGLFEEVVLLPEPFSLGS